MLHLQTDTVSPTVTFHQLVVSSPPHAAVVNSHQQNKRERLPFNGEDVESLKARGWTTNFQKEGRHIQRGEDQLKKKKRGRAVNLRKKKRERGDYERGGSGDGEERRAMDFAWCLTRDVGRPKEH